MMVEPSPSVDMIRMGLRMLGRMWRTMMRESRMPMARAART